MTAFRPGRSCREAHCGRRLDATRRGQTPDGRSRTRMFLWPEIRQTYRWRKATTKGDAFCEWKVSLAFHPYIRIPLKKTQLFSPLQLPMACTRSQPNGPELAGRFPHCPCRFPSAQRRFRELSGRTERGGYALFMKFANLKVHLFFFLKINCVHKNKCQ